MTGRLIRLARVRVGDTLVADAGFTCMVSGPKLVRRAFSNRLYVQCADGAHFLDSQVGSDGYLIGFSEHRPGPRDTAPAKAVPAGAGGSAA